MHPLTHPICIQGVSVHLVIRKTQKGTSYRDIKHKNRIDWTDSRAFRREYTALNKQRPSRPSCISPTNTSFETHIPNLNAVNLTMVTTNLSCWQIHPEHHFRLVVQCKVPELQCSSMYHCKTRVIRMDTWFGLAWPAKLAHSRDHAFGRHSF